MVEKIMQKNSNIRDEFAADLMDMKRLLKKHGMWDSESNKVILDAVKTELESHPEIYAKGAKNVEK